jgi:hypothetical protein
MPNHGSYCIHCGQHCSSGKKGPLERCGGSGIGCCTDPLGIRPGYNGPNKRDIRFNAHTGIEIPDWESLPRDVALRLAGEEGDMKSALGGIAIDPLIKLARDAHIPDHLVSRATAIYELVRDEPDRDRAILRIAGLLKAMAPTTPDLKIKELDQKASELELRSRELAEKAQRHQQAIFEASVREELSKKAAGRLADDKRLRTIRELTHAGLMSVEEAKKMIRGGT